MNHSIEANQGGWTADDLTYGTLKQRQKGVLTAVE